MPGSWEASEFPKLAEADHQVTSPVDRRYNCIAWAADETAAWWWPDQLGIGKWPPGVPRAETIDAFLQAYATLGYARCSDGAHAPGYEKVAIYAQRGADGGLSPTHAARQLEDGAWTSKLGVLEDIRHNIPDVLEDGIYGKAVAYLQRARNAT